MMNHMRRVNSNAIWTKSYRQEHLSQIKYVHFWIHPRYEEEDAFKHTISYIISFLRTLFPNHSFITTRDIKVNDPQILYILLNHRELHNFIPALPAIFILYNTLDFVDSSFIFPQNILLYSKAYRIIETKYINIAHYIKEVRGYTYYLPIITGFLGNRNLPVEGDNQSRMVLFYANPSNHLFYRSILQICEKEYPHIEFHLNEDLFHEADLIVRLYESPHSHYDNTLFSKCVAYHKICISEKCNDKYHENAYFDTTIFVEKSNISEFVKKIHTYLYDQEKINAIHECMEKKITKQVERNKKQAELILTF